MTVLLLASSVVVIAVSIPSLRNGSIQFLKIQQHVNRFVCLGDLTSETRIFISHMVEMMVISGLWMRGLGLMGRMAAL